MSEEIKETEIVEEEKHEEEKLLSEDEVNRLIAQAKSKAKAEAKKDLEEEVQKRLDEEKRLSALSERERQDEILSKREQELADREAAIAYKERIAETEDVLKERGLSSGFAKLLIGGDDEQTLENIKDFEGAFNKAVEDGVKEALSGKTPKVTLQNDSIISKDDFQKLGYQERLKFKEEYPKLYEDYTEGE